MKSKVTLKEMVGTKIIYAVLLVCYYWMWARQEWHDRYTTIQNVVFIFTIIFFAVRAVRIWKYGKEGKDGLAIQDLHKIDAILLKIMVVADIIIAFASAVAYIDGRMAGYALVGTILLLTVIRSILFCATDRKEV